MYLDIDESNLFLISWGIPVTQSDHLIWRLVYQLCLAPEIQILWHLPQSHHIWITAIYSTNTNFKQYLKTTTGSKCSSPIVNRHCTENVGLIFWNSCVFQFVSRLQFTLLQIISKILNGLASIHLKEPLFQSGLMPMETVFELYFYRLFAGVSSGMHLNSGITFTWKWSHFFTKIHLKVEKIFSSRKLNFLTYHIDCIYTNILI